MMKEKILKKSKHSHLTETMINGLIKSMDCLNESQSVIVIVYLIDIKLKLKFENIKFCFFYNVNINKNKNGIKNSNFIKHLIFLHQKLSMNIFKETL